MTRTHVHGPLEAIRTGLADVCLMAIEPSRAAEIAFTATYAIVEGAIRPANNPDVSVAPGS